MAKWYLRAYPYFIFILGLSLLSNFFLFYYKFSAPIDPISIIEEGVAQDTQKSEQEQINIYISGAINQPGQYQLPPGSIINDVIDKAGGLTSEADMTNSGINPGSLISSDQKIFIPSTNSFEDNNPTITENNPQPVPISSDPDKININTASIDELSLLNGVGEKTAQKIIDYRQNNHFDNIEEIMEVSGIGPKLFEKIKAEITI